MHLSPLIQPMDRTLENWHLGHHANGIADGEMVAVLPFSRRDLTGAYRFAGGIGSAWHGVEILVEQGSGNGVPTAALDTIKGYINTLSARELQLLDQVEVLAQACPQDAYWRQRYGIPDYYVRALTGRGRTQFWRGDTRTLRVFHHEQAHLLHFSGGIAGQQWSRAIQDDDRRLAELRAAGWTLTGLPVDRFDFDRDLLRLVPGGITGYAEFARSNGNTDQEDIAESIAWRKLGIRVGPIARGTAADGSQHLFTFDELFPARTRLVDQALRERI